MNLWGEGQSIDCTSAGIYAYSAAVCEDSDACEMLLERGFVDVVVDCESAMMAKTARLWVLWRGIYECAPKHSTSSRCVQMVVTTSGCECQEIDAPSL